MSPVTRKVNQRLSTEERISLFLETWPAATTLPQPDTIALITGARSVTVVKSVLYDMGIAG